MKHLLTAVSEIDERTFKSSLFFREGVSISSILSSSAAFLRIIDPSSSRESMILASSSTCDVGKKIIDPKIKGLPVLNK